MPRSPDHSPPIRYVILGEDGRHTTVGRAREPSAAELEAAAVTLRQAGMGAWYCTLAGEYYGRGAVELRAIRELVPSGVSFGVAADHFRAARAVTMAGGSRG